MAARINRLVWLGVASVMSMGAPFAASATAYMGSSALSGALSGIDHAGRTASPSAPSGSPQEYGAVPEPSTWAMIGGFGVVGCRIRRKGRPGGAAPAIPDLPG